MSGLQLRLARKDLARKVSARSSFSFLFPILLVLALATTFSRPAHAVGTFISAPSRFDHIHDTKRNLIYISSQNFILRYRISDGTFLSPIQLSGSLGGVDISPDGDTLAVANRTATGTTSNNSFYLINLPDSTVRTVSFPGIPYESGTWTVAYGSDGRLLISSRYGDATGSGWVPLRRFDPATAQVDNLTPDSSQYIRGETMLCASGDRSVIAFAESNSSGGPLGTYRVSDGVVTRKSTSGFLYEIGVNGSGTQFAVPTTGGTVMYNSSFLPQVTIGNYDNGLPLAAAYHPTQPKIYFPWSRTGEVRVFDAGTLQPTGSYNFETSFDMPNPRAFITGRTKISRDGSLLAVSVSGGVRFVSLTALSANPQTVSVNEDSSVGITLTATNVTPGSFAAYSIVTGPQHGTLTASATQSVTEKPYTYTPTANYYGSDSFVFQVSNSGQVSQAKVTINVNPVTDIPVADNTNTTTPKNTDVTITLPAFDGDYNALTYEVISWPTHGGLTLGSGAQLGTARYNPAYDYSGPDSFTWRVRDGYYYSNVATASITVENNSAPVAQADVYRTAAMTPFSVAAPGVLANDTNSDGTPFRAVLETQPRYGQVAMQPDGSFTWTPPTVPPGSTGPINETIYFLYRAVSATGQSGAVQVTIIQNRAPVANAQSLSTNENQAIPITLTAFDRDPLTYRIVDGPTHGTLTGTAPNLTYTPEKDWSGSDGFTFVASDGELESTLAQVSITVKALNTAPVASAQTVAVQEDTATPVVLSATDAQGNALTYEATRQPLHGTLTGTTPDLTYTPEPNFSGTDSLAFKASDGKLQSEEAVVILNVAAVNDAPNAQGQTLNGDEDSALDITLTGSDIDSDTLTFSIVNQPKHGSLSGTAPALTYTPNADYFGSDSFTFKVSDGTADSAPATISISLRGSSDTPRALGDLYIASEDQTLTVAAPGVLSNDSEVDGEALSAQVVTQPQHGTLVLNANGSFIYTPDADFNGADFFTYKATDGVLQSAAVRVDITVQAVNDAPVASAQSVATSLGLSKTVTLSGSDLEGSPLTYMVVSGPTKGTLSGTAPNLTYTPNLLFVGTDSFTFKVSDGQFDSAPATVSIRVYALPVATLTSATVLEDQTAPLNLSGTASDGATLSAVEILAAPSKGVLSGTGSSRTYTPGANYFGSDSLSYRVQDSRGAWSAPATVALTVTPVNDAPTFVLKSTAVSASRNSKLVSIPLFASAISAGPNETGQTVAFTVSGVTSFFSVQPAISPTGTLTFQPAKNKTGSTTVQLQLKDNGDITNGGRNLSEIKSFTITVK